MNNELTQLFALENPQKRGKALEQVLYNLFSFFKIGVHEAFCIYDNDSKKCYEQIDGIVEIGSNISLVEMKWEKDRIGAEPIGRFVGRIFIRAGVEGIFISYSGFTETGVKTANEALSSKIITLIELQDIISVLNQSKDLRAYFEARIRHTKFYKSSLHRINILELPDLDFSLLI